MNTGTYTPAFKRRRRSHPVAAPNANVTAFKSQLKDVFEAFPPLAEFVWSQQHPQQSFQDLYQVFVSCTPSPMDHHPPLPPSLIQPTHTNHALQSQCVTHRPPLNIRPLNEPQTQCVQPPTDTQSDMRLPSNTNTNTFVPHTPMDATDQAASSTVVDAPAIPAAEPTDPVSIFIEAKETMIRIANRNMEIRCSRIIQSLNHATQNNAKYCALLKQFTLNEAVKMNIVHCITNTLRPWKGGTQSPIQKRDQLTHNKAFKLVRAHWNRQKAQQLGETLFAVVLRNIFKIVLRIAELSRKEQVLFYIHLFRGLISDRVQFEQSMPRPLVPHACFDKSSGFKKLCQNLLDSFSGGVVSMVRIKTAKTQEVNGLKVTKYIKNRKRSKSLANAYDNCLQRVETMVSYGTKEFIQHAIQLHLNCIQSKSYEDRELVQWETIPPIAINQVPSLHPWININNY